MEHSATYSPEDNKLRLYPAYRLEKELYDRVRAAGFIWAPRQELFVAPMWTPGREDLLLELCGEIGDEDKSLVERQEERAERFEDYSDSRRQDAESAHKAVAAIADNIPLGQPILVGHHSEKHARKDAEKIENGMRRAVKMWETSKYWTDRAAGAIRHAKYKERPDVRERRIKTIEADIRRMRAEYTPQTPVHRIMQHGWSAKPDDPPVAHVWCGPKGRGGKWVEESKLPAIEKHYTRWIAHCERRLEYERAMLGETGGPAAEKFAEIQPGGKALISGEWVTILRVTKKNGKPCSVRTSAKYVSLRSIEEIKDYQPPTAEEAAKVQAAVKLAPLTNFPSEGSQNMTKQEWDDLWHDYKTTRTAHASEKYGAYRYRVAIRRGNLVPIFITDAKRVDPPAPSLLPPPEQPVFLNTPVRHQTIYKAPEPTVFDAMKDALKEGVKVVSAPQLFPTPPDLVQRMVYAAHLYKYPALRILEPSAGTGAILAALKPWDTAEIVAVEINLALADALRARFNMEASNIAVNCCDFLQQNGNLGTFDRILMNPPFVNGADIEHITHALTLLKDGGRLVAICADGPRQNAKLRPIVEESGGQWEPLPADTFKESGTGVNTVLLVVDK